VAVDNGFGRAQLRRAGIDEGVIAELAELRAAGAAYTVYLVGR